MVTVKIPFLDLIKLADSGQAFRIRVIDEDHIELIAFGRYLQVAKTGKDTFALSCSEKEFDKIWKTYLDLDRNYETIVSSIDKNDKYLIAAADFGYGIRILKQDVFETTISYFSRTHIKALRQKDQSPKTRQSFCKASLRRILRFPHSGGAPRA